MICYLRKGEKEKLLCVHNFNPAYLPDYVLPLEPFQQVEEIFNSDAERYGGSGKLNPHPEMIDDLEGKNRGLRIAIAPLATMVFKIYS